MGHDDNYNYNKCETTAPPPFHTADHTGKCSTPIPYLPTIHKIEQRCYSDSFPTYAFVGRTEKVEVLLNWAQTAFQYKTDEEQFGGERSLFADESLYYPYCDCEDRSILLSVLVRDLIGLDVVLLYFPGHLATAVKFKTEVTGDYLDLENGRYIVCDPTYIGASVGMAMPECKRQEVQVILLR